MKPDPYNDPECEVVGLLEVRPDYTIGLYGRH